MVKEIDLKTKILDNSNEYLSMLNNLTECFKQEKIKTVYIATGYWDLKGFALLSEAISDFLSREGTQIKLLLGMDPYIYERQLKNPIYKEAKSIGDFIDIDLQNLEVNDEYLSSVEVLTKHCGDGAEAKIQVRKYNKNEKDEIQFLHSKCYIFKGESKNYGYGIIGSSNFTEKGLTDNAELNYFESDSRLVLSEDEDFSEKNKSHLQWFKQKWELSEEWGQSFKLLLEKSPIGRKQIEKKKAKANLPELTPYEVYIRYVQDQIGDLSAESSDLIKSYLPPQYTPFDYQLDAVQQCAFYLKQKNGFMLGDVVGLGKTVVGTLLIKKFINEETLRCGRPSKVLILAPPSIIKGWIDTIKDFKIGNGYIDIISTGKLQYYTDFDTKVDDAEKYSEESIEIENLPSENDEYIDDGELEIDKTKNYGLIIIDESHNFRNNNTKKYQGLKKVISETKLKTGLQPYIGLLSATPQNNQPHDIRNQLFLFIGSEESNIFPAIEGGHWYKFLNEQQAKFTDLKNEKNTPEKSKALIQISEEIRTKVLDEIIVRRTRKDVAKHYVNSGLTFPKIVGPIMLEYSMDEALADLFYRTCYAFYYDADVLLELRKKGLDRDRIFYARYRAIEYFVDKGNSALYTKRNLDPEKISDSLALIMQYMVVKRLESSFKAFFETLSNLAQNTQNMIDMLDSGTVFICPDIDVNGEFKKYREKYGVNTNTPIVIETVYDELRKKMQKKKEAYERNPQKQNNNREFSSSAFKTDYIKQLNRDKALILSFLYEWKAFVFDNYDPKLELFKDKIDTLFDHKIENNGVEIPSKVVIFSEAIATIDEIEKALISRGKRVIKVTGKNKNEVQPKVQANFDANYKGEQEDDYDAIVTSEVLAEGINLHRANVILNYDTLWNATRIMQRVGRVNRIGSKAKEVYVYNFYPTDEGNDKIQLKEKSHTKIQAFHALFGEDSQVFSTKEILSEKEFNKIVEGEESPIMQHVANLKEYKKKHKDRFEFIKNKPLRDLGGVLPNAKEDALIVWGYENGTRHNMLNDKEAPISFISMLDKLVCSEEDNFVAPFLPDDIRINITKDNSFKFVSAQFRAIDTIHDNDYVKAKELLSKLVNKIQNKDEKTQKIIIILRKEIRSKNENVIRFLLRNEKRISESSLFPNEDFQNLISTELQSLAGKSVNKLGQAHIVLAILK